MFGNIHTRLFICSHSHNYTQMLLRIPRSLSAALAEGPGAAQGTMHIKRDDRKNPRGLNDPTAIAVAAVVGGIIVLGVSWILVRSLRARYPEPKYIPTPFLKRLWTRWTPSNMNYQRPAAEGENRWGGASRSGAPGLGNTDNSYQGSEQMRSSPQATAAVDRHASVRSVMTLPAYRPKANDGEEVLGVEGERDGIDVVVEMPTAEQDEVMRDQEMDALFQIRQARRRQLEERDAMQARREEARAANDAVAMRALRNQAREARVQHTEEIEALRGMQENAKETRQRAISAVSYAGIGEVRHDGSRARANSGESERAGLLSDAASIAMSSQASISLSTRRLSSQGRNRSGSELSIDPSRSRPVSPGFPTAGSSASFRSITPIPTPRRSSRAGSNPMIVDAAEADLGEGGGTLPPDYQEHNISNEAVPTASMYSVPSGRNTPLHEPPPEYPGPVRNVDYHRMSRHVADLLASGGNNSSARSSPDLTSTRHGSGGAQPVPQIVVEPSTARPESLNNWRF